MQHSKDEGNFLYKREGTELCYIVGMWFLMIGILALAAKNFGGKVIFPNWAGMLIPAYFVVMIFLPRFVLGLINPKVFDAQGSWKLENGNLEINLKFRQYILPIEKIKRVCYGKILGAKGSICLRIDTKWNSTYIYKSHNDGEKYVDESGSLYEFYLEIDKIMKESKGKKSA